MRRLQRTMLTWRFENDLAPASPNFMPVSLADMSEKGVCISRVEISLFRDKAEMGVWLVIGAGVLPGQREGIRTWLFRVFRPLGVPGLRLVTEIDDDETTEDDRGHHQHPQVTMNSNNARLSFEFDRVPGEAFTTTAMRVFYGFVDALEVPESWCYQLPYPVVYQETMVYEPNDGWTPFGHILADTCRLEMSKHEQLVYRLAMKLRGISVDV
ncbi:hypothetical protein KW800_01230 [Candidatus Parcubacteria bacterium]|nr:hypothetical protein [Candidatus Parcubacteria bacterium]